jgi:hypothetical protein
MLISIALVFLLLTLVVTLPAWPHSLSWGYGPSSIAGIALLALIAWLLLARL